MTDWQQPQLPMRFLFRGDPTSTLHYVLAWRVNEDGLRYMTIDGMDIATSSPHMMFAEVCINGQWAHISVH